MDRETKNQILDAAVTEITKHPNSTATLVSVLSHVFSEGYRYGLHQGHADVENDEDCQAGTCQHPHERDE